MKKIIFGGTFNPLHIGHLHLADEIQYMFPYAQIIFVPSFIPAHKRLNTMISPDQRLEMLKLALKNTNWLVDDCEIKRKGVSYSIDTVRYITKKYSLTENPGLIIGDDLLKGLHLWKDFNSLLGEADLIVARREQLNNENIPKSAYLVDNAILPVSSSMIRERVKANRAYKYLLPSEVYLYIEKKSLYD